MILLLSAAASAFTLGGSRSASTAASASSSESESASADAASSPVGDAGALVVLGQTVDEVQTPGTGPDLGISLGGAFEDGELPDSYAVEIAPAWLFSGTNDLTLREYAAGGWRSLGWNSQVSLATVTDDDATRAALAWRTTYWGPPIADTEVAKFVADYDRALAGEEVAKPQACVATIVDLVDTSRAALKELKELANTAKAAQRAFVDACAEVDADALPRSAKLCADPEYGYPTQKRGGGKDTAADEAKLASLRALEAAQTAAQNADAKLNESKSKAAEAAIEKAATKEGKSYDYSGCDDLLARRQGFLMDVGGGFGVTSPNSIAAATRPDVVRVWVGPGRVWEKFSLAGVVRLSAEDFLTDTPTLGADAGVGVAYQWDRLTLSPEVLGGVKRRADALTWALQPTVAVDVRIAKGLWVASAIGVSFPMDEEGSFISYTSLKFGVERQRTLPLLTPDELGTEEDG